MDRHGDEARLALHGVQDARGVRAHDADLAIGVLVAGRVVKRDGALVGVDLPALQARLLESRDRIAAAAGITI